MTDPNDEIRKSSRKRNQTEFLDPNLEGDITKAIHASKRNFSSGPNLEDSPLPSSKDEIRRPSRKRNKTQFFDPNLEGDTTQAIRASKRSFSQDTDDSSKTINNDLISEDSYSLAIESSGFEDLMEDNGYTIDGEYNRKNSWVDLEKKDSLSRLDKISKEWEKEDKKDWADKVKDSRGNLPQRGG